MERIELLTIEEFVRLYEQEGPFELIDGERKPIVPAVMLHGKIIRALWFVLHSLCLTNGLGEVYVEMPYVVTYSSNWVKGSRVPDLMFFRAARWEAYISEHPDWESKPAILVPDLAMEVISPTDYYSDIQDKVERYLADGVRLIWVIDPRGKRAQVYEDNQIISLGANDTLSGGTVIPGFSLLLADLFQPQS